MKRMWRFVGSLVLAVGLTACEPIDIDDGGGGGGGGGGGNVLFTRGFVFVRESDRNVYVVDDQGDANNPQRITTNGGASHPSVSRNGRSVVFVQQTATGFELRTVPTDASANPSTVFASGGSQCAGCTNFRFPTFNPSGNVIVFAFNRGAGTNFDLARVNADGSGFQELTASQPAFSFGAPSFFPDGQSVLAPAGSSEFTQLARVSLTGTVSFVSNNLGGTEVRTVVNRAVVSPDGSQVALDGQVSTGGTRIFVGSLSPFTGLTRITEHPGEPGAQDSFPSWLNANQVGFVSNAGGSQNIYRVSLTSPVGPGTLLIPSASQPSYGGT
jgi:TolB protein